MEKLESRFGLGCYFRPGDHIGALCRMSRPCTADGPRRGTVETGPCAGWCDTARRWADRASPHSFTDRLESNVVLILTLSLEGKRQPSLPPPALSGADDPHGFVQRQVGERLRLWPVDRAKPLEAVRMSDHSSFERAVIGKADQPDMGVVTITANVTDRRSHGGMKVTKPT